MAAAITIFENDMVTVWYYPDKKMIHHKMHKYTHGQVLRDALAAGAKAMEQYHAHKWLSDDRLNPVISPDDQKWTANVWRPQILKAGWKFWAIVEPENLINKIRMEKMQELYSGLNVTVQLFKDSEEAMKWLESQ